MLRGDDDHSVPNGRWLHGYLNFGDGLCLLAGWILGPWYGFAAGIVLAVLLEQAVCRVPGLMRPSGKNCT